MEKPRPPERNARVEVHREVAPFLESATPMGKFRLVARRIIGVKRDELVEPDKKGGIPTS